MPRKKSEPHITNQLAEKFVERYLKVKFDYGNPTHRRYLRDAKSLVNPSAGNAYDPSLVWGCLLALENGMFDFNGQITSIWIVTYGVPPYIDQYKEWIESPPPFYEADLIRDWEFITGKQYPRLEENGILNPCPFIPVLE